MEAREGRVVAREEQINRDNGRDPIEKYFFSLRYLNMPVNLAAYRALEAGSIYIVYLHAPQREFGFHRAQNGDCPASRVLVRGKSSQLHSLSEVLLLPNEQC